MPCAQRSWLANLSVVAHLLNLGALCYGRQAQPGPVHFPDRRQERFIKALPEYHVVAPVRVDASGHFLSYGLYHPVTGNSRRKRDLDGPEDRVYYRISHEEKDLFFNLSVNQEFLSKSYILERRYGNLSHVKMVASSVPPCHLRGTVLQQGTRIGTAALSACQGLVSAWVSHLPPLPQDPVLLAFTPSASGFTHTFSACRLNTCDVHGPGCQTGWGQRHKSKS
uniref:Peptidase M12B propeptide domain-containing protein n=1 Tax=Ursus americanus TaxID=9643 RepID=A0A452RCT7_URSAM